MRWFFPSAGGVSRHTCKKASGSNSPACVFRPTTPIVLWHAAPWAAVWGHLKIQLGYILPVLGLRDSSKNTSPDPPSAGTKARSSSRARRPRPPRPFPLALTTGVNGEANGKGGGGSAKISMSSSPGGGARLGEDFNVVFARRRSRSRYDCRRRQGHWRSHWRRHLSCRLCRWRRHV